MLSTYSLQARLDEITEQTRALVQADRLAIADRWIAELFSTGIEDRALTVDASAPMFALPDATTGRTVRAADLLALGPLVLKFFRGRWDPYDMTELEVWQQAFAEVRSRGALLVAVSPQLPRQNDFTASQHGITFPLLTDKGCELAEQYGIAYALPDDMQQYYRSIMVNVPFMNGDNTWRLPLASTFVIAQNGRVAYSEVHADHRVRPEPHDVLAALDALIAQHS